MREILFRGKRIDNGEWVYGSFCMDALEQFNGLCGVDGFIRLYDKDSGKMQMYEVDRETVGQFTGLTDKNGKKMCEGDIIEHHAQGNIIVNRGVVVWDASEGRFAYQLRTMLPGFYMHNPETVEVIGNIHDNPELLEASDGN